jgi:hypothetical protein
LPIDIKRCIIFGKNRKIKNMETRRMPHKLRVDTSDLQYIKANDYKGLEYDYKGQPFTGFELYGYYENGQVVGECEYVNGEQMGWDIQYYENGNVETESLDYGATNVYYAKYDIEGNKILSHFFAPEFLEKVCAITGEDPNNVKK